MQKLALAVTALTGLALAFATLNQLDSKDELTSIDDTSESLGINAYSEGINTVLYDVNGQINYTLRADSQTQFVDDTTAFLKPYIRLFQEGVPAWNVVADSGVIVKENNQDSKGLVSRKIELTGNVEVYSINQVGNRTVILTEQLFVDPSTETLTTDLPVQMHSESITQSAVGMFADLKIDEIVFYSNTRGMYEPINVQ